MIYFILCYAGMPAADEWEKALLWLMNVMMYVEPARGRKEEVSLVDGTQLQGGKYQVQK